MAPSALHLAQFLTLWCVCWGWQMHERQVSERQWHVAAPYAPNHGIATGNHTQRWSAQHNHAMMAALGSFSLASFKTADIQEMFQASEGTSCQQDVTQLMEMLANAETQAKAFSFLDAAAKPPKGLMNGNLMWVGDYQECNDIETILNPKTNKTFRGKYFTSFVYMNNKPVYGTSPLFFGVCFPDSCTNTNVTSIMENYLGVLDSQSKTIKNLNLSVVGAVSETEKTVHGGFLATIILSCIIFAVVILGTLVDLICHMADYGETEPKTFLENPETLYSQDSSSEADRAGLLAGEVFTDSGNFRVHIQDTGSRTKRILTDICCAFSFLSNSKKLFSTETAKGPLACLNGIRVLSMWWVILGHTYVFVVYFADNMLEGLKIEKRFTFQPILNGTFSVDSFFFLSGLLVAYLSIKEIKEKGMGLNFWIYYVGHRYWRLTPLYGFIILLFVNVLPNIVSSPYWYMVMPGSQFIDLIDECKSTWWANLLYINNFYPYYGNIGKTCVGWAWYLANDMQFYLLWSPILIFLLSHNRRVMRTAGLIVASFFIVQCVIVRGALVGYYGIHGLMGKVTQNGDDPLAKNDPMYIRPYTRSSVYVIGILVGYVLAIQKCRVRIPRLAAIVGWLAFIAVGMCVIFGQYYYNHNGKEMPIVASGFYVSLCRTLWGLCLAWLVLACVSGKAGLIKFLLSWKLWAPLGRLTYAAYLIHPILIYAVYLNKLQPVHFTDLNMVYFFIGHLVLSYALAFVLSMLVEAPMIQLEKLLLKLLASLF